MASIYGKTWWGQQWLNSLQNIDYSNRLPMAFLTHARVLTANGAILPQVVKLPNKEYFIRWLPAMMNKKEKKSAAFLDKMLPPGVLIGIDRKKNR